MAKRVYGIDLGTTYSCISYVDEHGRPVVLQNAEGELTTPSVVWFESPENIVVGRTAKDMAVIQKDRVVSTIKRQMGNHVEFEVDGRTYLPQEISAQILRKLVKDASALTGEQIEDVVITCPAYFGVPQREATKQAGEIAGLNVRYVIPEPTAAAIAYGIEQTENQNILVYDLGGGTFDVTLVTISPEEIAVVTIGGDHELGGKDWDEDLASYMARSFQSETGIPADQILADLECYQELMNDAERLKIRLSSATTVPHRVRYQSDQARMDITREKFDEITAARLERTLSLTDEVLARGKLEGIGKIDKLLLVGGSTYMPQVIARMSQYPFESKQFDPNQAVAKGAAIFGHRCALEEAIKIRIAGDLGKAAEDINLESVPAKVRENAERQVAKTEGVSLGNLRNLLNTKITNSTSHSFGIVVVPDDNPAKEVVANLVVVDDAVPRKVTRRFGTLEDNQTATELRIMQNKERTSETGHVELSQCNPEEPIGIATLEFDRPLPKASPIEVTFELAPDGCLTLHGRDLTTGREVNAEFKTDSIMSKEEVVAARGRALAMAVS